MEVGYELWHCTPIANLASNPKLLLPVSDNFFHYILVQSKFQSYLLRIICINGSWLHAERVNWLAWIILSPNDLKLYLIKQNLICLRLPQEDTMYQKRHGNILFFSAISLLQLVLSPFFKSSIIRFQQALLCMSCTQLIKFIKFI